MALRDTPTLGTCPAEDHIHQRGHAGQRGGAGEDVQFLQRFPAPQSRGQPAQAEDVVQMAVGEQDFVQAAEAEAAAQQLPLGAFAAVDHEAVFVVHDNGRRQPALDRRCRRRCAEEDEFKQERLLHHNVPRPSRRWMRGRSPCAGG
ncbi:MAG: hypothetical protein R2854_05180 [Caldilineaceae bacterium]